MLSSGRSCSLVLINRIKVEFPTLPVDVGQCSVAAIGDTHKRMSVKISDAENKGYVK